MATLVSTGQITIVDTNDARPITAYLTSSPGMQQIFTKDESTVSYLPSWFTANSSTGIIISAKAFVGSIGGANEITGLLTNRKFTEVENGTAITTATTSTSFVNDSLGAISNPFTVTHNAGGSSIRIKGNLKDTIGQFNLFFEGDYTDPVTALVSKVIAQITLSVVKTGTNAVYVITRGVDTIEEATGTVKNVAIIAADLVRAAGVDTTGVTYKWYADGGSTQITTALSGYATLYGLKTSTAGTKPTGSAADLGINIPATTAGTTYNTLVIAETAVQDIEVFKVVLTDSDSKEYASFFTVYDISDPYDVRLLSTSGDKLQNGVGSTNIFPDVFYGSVRVSDLTGWTFTWYFYDRNGNRGAFIDTSKISVAGGAPITASTAGSSAVITYSGTSYAFTAGQIIKAVKPDGTAFFYEVASSTTNNVTIRAPSTNTWLSFSTFPAPSAIGDFVGGRLFGCTTSGGLLGGTRSTNAGGVITLTGDEVDVKARILCEASRP